MHLRIGNIMGESRQNDDQSTRSEIDMFESRLPGLNCSIPTIHKTINRFEYVIYICISLFGC